MHNKEIDSSFASKSIDKSKFRYLIDVFLKSGEHMRFTYTKAINNPENFPKEFIALEGYWFINPDEVAAFKCEEIYG